MIGAAGSGAAAAEDAAAGHPLAVLQRIRTRPAAKPRPGERCEMCAELLPEDHDHVVNLDTRALRCSCRACYLLFTQHGAGGGRSRAVPNRYLALGEFSLSPSQWEDLQIPVSVAFFLSNSDSQDVAAFYPSPAGATESLLPLGTWDEIVSAHPELSELEDDVEALLVRVGEHNECFIVPIDACYELVGQLRQTWKGFDGGIEARRAMTGFFDKVRSRARPLIKGVSGG